MRGDRHPSGPAGTMSTYQNTMKLLCDDKKNKKNIRFLVSFENKDLEICCMTHLVICQVYIRQLFEHLKAFIFNAYKEKNHNKFTVRAISSNTWCTLKINSNGISKKLHLGQAVKCQIAEVIFISQTWKAHHTSCAKVEITLLMKLWFDQLVPITPS